MRRCGAPNWEQLHFGCFATSAFLDAYAGRAYGAAISFENGFSLERCALHCQTYAHAATGFAAAGDLCICLNERSMPAALAATTDSSCNATCNAVEGANRQQIIA